MKKIAVISLAVLLGICPIFGHPLGGNAQGLFGLKAEYVHVLLNPLAEDLKRDGINDT